MGLDLGTDSAGWCVTDENGKIIIAKYKDAKFNMDAYKILVSHYDNINDKGEEKIQIIFSDDSEKDLED